MENVICLDTNILIDILRNESEAKQWLEKNKEKQLCTSAITVYELWCGAIKSQRKSEILMCESLLERFPLLSFSSEAAKKAAELTGRLEKQGRMIDMRDIFIAAIVVTESASLKTNNTKHFVRIEEVILAE